MHIEDIKQRMETRVALIHSWNVLVDTLALLARSGSEQARLAWEALPGCAPVNSKNAVTLACRAANRAPIPLDALPEWDAYLDALTRFHALPLYGPAPMPIPSGCFAALDSGREWLFSRQRVAV